MPAPARAVPACSGRRNFAPSSRLFVSYRLPTRVCCCPCPRRPCRSPAGAPRSWPFSRALLCPPAFPGGRALPGAVPPPRPLASALRPLRGLRPARSLGRRPGAFPPPGPPLRGPGSAGLNWSVSLAVGLRGPAAGRGRPLRSRTRPRSGPRRGARPRPRLIPLCLGCSRACGLAATPVRGDFLPRSKMRPYRWLYCPSRDGMAATCSRHSSARAHPARGFARFAAALPRRPCLLARARSLSPQEVSAMKSPDFQHFVFTLPPEYARFVQAAAKYAHCSTEQVLCLALRDWVRSPARRDFAREVARTLKKPP